MPILEKSFEVRERQRGPDVRAEQALARGRRRQARRRWCRGVEGRPHSGLHWQTRGFASLQFLRCGECGKILEYGTVPTASWVTYFRRWTCPECHEQLRHGGLRCPCGYRRPDGASPPPFREVCNTCRGHRDRSWCPDCRGAA